MNIAEKEAMVEQLSHALEKTKTLVISNYQGLNVAELTGVRNRLRQKGAILKVVKNNLALLALRKAGLDELEKFLVGPVAFIMSEEDSLEAVKEVLSFTRTYPSFTVRGGWMEGETVPPDKFPVLATIPSREALLARVVWGIQLPLWKLQNVSVGIIRQLVLVLKEVAKSFDS